MINSSEYFEKYISHQDIKTYFENNSYKTEMNLFTSYYGNITVNGRKSSHQEDYNFEPVNVLVQKRNEKIEDPFGNIDNILETIENDDTNFPKRTPQIVVDKWQPYPKDTITHFDWQVVLVVKDSDIEINKHIIERLKFFPTMEQAEMNYVKMIEYKFKSLGIFDAFDKFNNLCKTLGDRFPEEFI
jgi:hypothetical protein